MIATVLAAGVQASLATDIFSTFGGNHIQTLTIDQTVEAGSVTIDGGTLAINNAEAKNSTVGWISVDQAAQLENINVQYGDVHINNFHALNEQSSLSQIWAHQDAKINSFFASGGEAWINSALFNGSDITTAYITQTFNANTITQTGGLLTANTARF